MWQAACLTVDGTRLSNATGPPRHSRHGPYRVRRRKRVMRSVAHCVALPMGASQSVEGCVGEHRERIEGATARSFIQMSLRTWDRRFPRESDASATARSLQSPWVRRGSFACRRDATPRWASPLPSRDRPRSRCRVPVRCRARWGHRGPCTPRVRSPGATQTWRYHHGLPLKALTPPCLGAAVRECRHRRGN